MTRDEANAPETSLEHYRELWLRKPALRAVYTDIYQRILAAAAPGTILEVGGGSGNFKGVVPDVVTSDILFAPWLDIVCDAQRLPFSDRSLSDVVMFDVIHHVEFPVRALSEAYRVLRKGGRLILCEPAITPVSGLFYRFFHAEPVDMSVDPLRDGSISADRDPYDSNQAIPTLLVGRFRERLARIMPEFPLLRVEWFSFLAYPLSGGFQPWSFLPAAAAGPLLALEWSLRRVIGRLAAFRLLAVYEKQD